MNPWQILEIAPTNDKTQIKRAFAKKLKENPPDKDASLYQQIREAYNAALRLSEYVAAGEYEDDEEVPESKSEFNPEAKESGDDSSESYETSSIGETKNSESAVESDDVDSDSEDVYDPDEDFFAEKESSSSLDISEIARLRESLNTSDNARSLSDIAGIFPVKNWHFNEEADYSFAMKLFFWMKFPVYISALIFLII